MKQPSELVRYERAPIMASIDLGVLHRKMRQPVITCTMVPHEPPRELFDRPDVMVGRLDAESARA
jgi:hypothetical protein